MEDKVKKYRAPKPVYIDWTDNNKTFNQGPFASVADALKWLNQNGVDGETYRIITVELEVTMKVESRRVACFE